MDEEPVMEDPLAERSDEDEEEGEDGQRPSSGTGGLQAAQRQSTRRKPHVDLARLDVQTLRKYRRVFKLGDPPELVTKDELLPAVLRHWQNQTVDEDETALAFAFALRKQATSGGASPGGTVKTFKPAVKPVAKGKFK